MLFFLSTSQLASCSPSYSMGAVGDLRRVKHAISVARAVMERSTHTFLVGEKATQFAVEMGFQEESLATNHSKQMWAEWKANNCQPNYRQNVVPNPRTSCGPYQPTKQLSADRRACPSAASELNHDTIGMVVIDGSKRLAAGTSTNGMNHKIPGRIGDSPIPGAGAYADQEVGGAAATGDGDILMRYLPSFHAVESMRRGADPRSASVAALHLIVRHHPQFVGALVAVSVDGTYGRSFPCSSALPIAVRAARYNVKLVVTIFLYCDDSREFYIWKHAAPKERMPHR
ncbi:N(4)-(Beta-N-acetylglucosaminyl)-L-asparaginase-like isoform X3 [Dermacentor andersoni]|uniref:N(4)-(Beta-N-acetylglucosaminyl)-L-asparaginase- like isoform X3 n=1 Tax=Dermacentor andersoni TaxID=34620 RepID=UPI002416AADE|nr:N(4)-(Beta-N-acetylglucosaminyl)-L-asparaginase-like isoform X3 [Dermacentor andersoni]